jgi:acyl-CoA synthetase (AMP-forming)/AMP-acid ligase II
MPKATTLTDVIENNRGLPRAITYLEGEDEAHDVSFGELYERALGILFHLQRIGARRGDKLILLLANNEQFIDVFWAAILGGIVPVPVALGISDEHRHKLLRIAQRLGRAYIYTERRALERIGAFAAGPRHCIGETFALYEMLMHLYKVARRYRLIHVPDRPLELEAQINLRTRYPLHMRLERR